jgi:chemotaxis protein MotA
MTYMLGLVLGVFSIIFALKTLGQNIGLYFDHVAVYLVLGGTMAVAIITLPWQQYRTMIRCLFSLFTFSSGSYSQLLMDCLHFIYATNTGNPIRLRSVGLAREILKDGYELITLEFKIDEIEAILHERVHQAGERSRQVANAFRTLAKYPPAFGLVGTVFGLVNLMRSISEGLEPKQAGLQMAIALIATLYGLLLSNLIIAPIGESVLKRTSADKHRAEIALQGVLLAAQKISLLKAQEMLNSHLPASQRVNFLRKTMDSGSDAA